MFKINIPNKYFVRCLFGVFSGYFWRGPNDISSAGLCGCLRVLALLPERSGFGGKITPLILLKKGELAQARFRDLKENSASRGAAGRFETR